MVFDFSKAVIAYTFSVLLSCPFPGPLVKERRLLLGIPPLTTPIGIPWLLASPAPNPGYIKQKENSLSCHFQISRSLPKSAIFSPHFRVCLCFDKAQFMDFFSFITHAYVIVKISLLNPRSQRFFHVFF